MGNKKSTRSNSVESTRAQKLGGTTRNGCNKMSCKVKLGISCRYQSHHRQSSLNLSVTSDTVNNRLMADTNKSGALPAPPCCSAITCVLSDAEKRVLECAWLALEQGQLSLKVQKNLDFASDYGCTIKSDNKNMENTKECMQLGGGNQINAVLTKHWLAAAERSPVWIWGLMGVDEADQRNSASGSLPFQRLITQLHQFMNTLIQIECCDELQCASLCHALGARHIAYFPDGMLQQAHWDAFCDCLRQAFDELLITLSSENSNTTTSKPYLDSKNTKRARDAMKKFLENVFANMKQGYYWAVVEANANGYAHHHGSLMLMSQPRRGTKGAGIYGSRLVDGMITSMK